MKTPNDLATTEHPVVDSAERSAATVSSFLTTLAHDLRSPLGVVAEAIAQLRGELSAELTDEQRLLITLASRGFQRLNRIADTVGLVGALDSGQFQLHQHMIDLVALVRAANATAVAVEPRREVELVADLPELPGRAWVDEDRMSFAISEIIINAIRHARSRVRMSLALNAERALIVVEDDGQGVTEPAKAAMFRRFAPRRSHAGLGVGLSAAFDVIRAHGGSLNLEPSTLPAGRLGTTGARFVVSLPVAAGA